MPTNTVAVLEKLGISKTDYEPKLVSSSCDLQNAGVLDGAFDVYELTRKRKSNSVVRGVRSNDIVRHICACGSRIWNFYGDKHFGTSAEVQLAVFVRAKAISDLIGKVRTKDGIDMLFSLFDQENTRLGSYSAGRLEVMDDRLVEGGQTSTLGILRATDSEESIIPYTVEKWYNEKRPGIYTGV